MKQEENGGSCTMRSFAIYSSQNIIRQIKSKSMRWAGHVACMGGEGEVYRVLVGKPEGKRPLGRPWRSWEHRIRMDFREIDSVV
jgi:hypothetical protein